MEQWIWGGFFNEENILTLNSLCAVKTMIYIIKMTWAFPFFITITCMICSVLIGVWFGVRWISCSLMGGVCSWRRDHADEYTIQRGVSCSNFKNGGYNWMGTSFFQQIVDYRPGKGSVPSLMELCIYQIRQVLGFVWLAGGSMVCCPANLMLSNFNRTSINILLFLCCQET